MIKQEIPFYKQDIDDKNLSYIKKVLDDENNDIVKELETQIKDFIGCSDVISTYNSTSALHLCLSTMELKRADKVLMSVNSFPNLPEVVRHFDAEPIFIDTQKDGFNIDLDKLEEYLENNNSKKLRAVIISFVAGEIPDLDKLYRLKSKYNIIIIEDASNTLGAMYKDKLIGNLEADMTVFSLSPVNIDSIACSSGFITTNSGVFANRARLLRNHALEIHSEANGNLDYIYDVYNIGHKYNMSNLDAAFNLAQFYKVNNSIDKRYEIVKLYSKELEGVKHIQLPELKENHLFTHFIIKITKNRDSFARALKDEGISTGLVYIPLHLMTYYKQKYNLKITSYSNALTTYSQTLALPMYESLSSSDIKYICNVIKQISKEWI